MQQLELQVRLEQALGRAMALARSGLLDAADAALQQILRTDPDQPDALQLLGMVARKRGNQDVAAKFLRRSLDLRPDQPHVLNNLGNCLTDLGQHTEAAANYQKALGLKADYTDARINLALAHINLGRPTAAHDVLQPVISTQPEHARAWAVLGQALAAMKAGSRAIEAYRTALRLRPGHLPWLHNLAVALRLVGRADEALPIFADCAARSPDEARIQYNLGHCLQDLGRVDEAAMAYRKAIRSTPTDSAIHDSLGRLLWQHGRISEHLQSYRDALVQHPDDPGLLAGLANRMVLAGQAQEAVELLAPLTARGVVGAELQYRLGQALWSAEKPEMAFAAFNAALTLDPDHPSSLREAARSSVIVGRMNEAEERIARRLAADTTDQQALALQGIAWRLTGDTRADWLNDPSFIGAFRLAPPDCSTAAFNQNLDRALSALHIGQQHPLEQTLLGGTQTADDLFSRELPEVGAARAMIEAAVSRYISELPNNTGHPFLCRKSSVFAFSGSWSVRLHTGGHHRNHIHPEGWISAVYYVALPGSVADGQQGWLKFGESGLNLGSREQILQTVQPEVGLLVLFPSYFYHGTIPFADQSHRTTIAFDIIPGD